jgi:anti-sigma regulatory factor (Ser/Thr protein kinase)
MVQKLTLPNDIETIPQMSEFVEMACEEAGFDISTTMSLNLAIEEAVVNVMSYAYPEGERGYVDIEVSAENGGITFRIIDSGKPFDPTSQGEVDTTLSAEQRSIGGLGIHLVRSIMDSVTYQRDADMNILTLQKLLPKDSEL